MLRLDDHSDDPARAMLLSSVRLMPSRSYTLYGGEGKNNMRGLQPAILWNSFDGESPGYWLELWLSHSGVDARLRSDFLFPLVRDDGTID